MRSKVLWCVGLGLSGFAATTIRTDYRFESLVEAETLTRFFFGDGLADQVVEKNWRILPEWTGIWWKTWG